MSAPQDKPHPYQWVMITLSLLWGVLYGVSFFHTEFRILHDKYLVLPLWLSPAALAAIGLTFGMAIGGLVAPEGFWKSHTGRKWLLVGDSSEFWWQGLLNRWKCFVLVALLGTLTEELFRLVYLHY